MKTIQHSYGTLQFPVQQKKASVVRRFMDWCHGQEKNRLAWLAVIIAGHGCVITPLTLGFVMLAGNDFSLWPWIIGAMGMSLISNLAAMPTRVTIPIFFISLLIALAVIAKCVVVAAGV
jgi:hypothetical protein